MVVSIFTGCAQAPPAFDMDVAMQYLLRQCEYGPRPPGSAAHDSTRAFITTHLRNRGAVVQLQRFELDDPYGTGRLRLTNITGSFNPEARERVLLAAHYDTRPRADQETVDSLRVQPILGANDGASGVAVLLAIADVLAKNPPQNLGVDLAFFDGEDYGREGEYTYYLLGSKYFAANLGGYRPACGVLLDMVCARDARIRQEGYSLQQAGELTQLLFERAARLGLDVFVPEPANPIYDDHLPLLNAGIPMVDLIGLPYPYWHTLADTPDKCDPETLRQVGTLLLDFLYDYPF